LDCLLDVFGAMCLFGRIPGKMLEIHEYETCVFMFVCDKLTNRQTNKEMSDKMGK
jgi:hypothetical protein